MNGNNVCCPAKAAYLSPSTQSVSLIDNARRNAMIPLLDFSLWASLHPKLQEETHSGMC